MQRVAIIDTSLMCCWIKVPGRETAGSHPNLWDFARTDAEIRRVIDLGYSLVFPMTTLIETGNHISHSAALRYETAGRLVEQLLNANAGETPWAAFSQQFSVISAEEIRNLAISWPTAAARGVSLGDHLITAVADYYSMSAFEVLILTSDAILASHVPTGPERIPRRRG